MSVTSTKSDNNTKIKIETSRLDVSNMQDIKSDIESIIDTDKNIILDLSQIEFLDSSGLSVLISILKQLNKAEGSSLILCGLNSQPNELMQITQLDGVFDIQVECD